MKNINEIIQLAENYDHELPPFPVDGTVEESPLPRLIDQTLLKADARPGQIEQLCLEARKKVIIKTAALNRFEKIVTSLFGQAAGAEFVKTSTGFGAGGETAEERVA